MTTAAPERAPEGAGSPADDRVVGLSRTADGRPVPSASRRARRRGRVEDPFVGWVAAVSVGLLALFLRLWKLGTPHEFLFDETYYAEDAWSLLHFGAEQEYRQGADARILAGDLEQWTGNPAYVVHPPGGKWMIAAGEAVFGFDPTGWRVAVAVLGTLSVLVVARIARRMFGSTVLGCVAGLLLALDGLHFVSSRTALLDLILMFWALLAFGCLVLDRDATRSRLASWRARRRVPLEGYGPALGLRPWRLAAGVCLGLACATKWSGLWFVVAFGLLSY
ncbi:phospholipid carrier-dependent glycosyltransferase, partial [Streptomyces sp.]|uniref:phospholipid carrier-dependent glycosyltransferase n=1 Tax=Streptomyces sp. TaxID=1931 RepID=UPI002D472009